MDVLLRNWEKDLKKSDKKSWFAWFLHESFLLAIYIPLINGNGLKMLGKKTTLLIEGGGGGDFCGLNDAPLNRWGLMRFVHDLETVKLSNIYSNVYLV